MTNAVVVAGGGASPTSTTMLKMKMTPPSIPARPAHRRTIFSMINDSPSAGITAKESDLLLNGYRVLSNSYDYISYLLSCVDVPVSFGNLLQRIASVYYRSYLSRFNKLPQENQILGPVRHHSAYYFLAAHH